MDASRPAVLINGGVEPTATAVPCAVVVCKKTGRALKRNRGEAYREHER
jgi:hypothetical protein